MKRALVLTALVLAIGAGAASAQCYATNFASFGARPNHRLPADHGFLGYLR
jgi:hypothetical protein